MAVATVTIRATFDSTVSGRYVCDSSPTLTPINVGFVPSFVEVWNITDGDVYSFYSSDMADGACISITAATAAVASGAITPIAQTDGTNHGFSVGTNAAVQEANKTWGFRAYR
jgi:hypothetical protein